MRRHIQWRDAMSVDHGVIDDDHRHLIDIINRFTDHVVDSPDALAEAVDVRNALKFYTETHFTREERLQALAGYPESRLQHDDHRRLLATLDEIIVATRSGADPARITEDLGRLLKHWLLDHIIKLDLRMKPYAPLMKRHTTGLPPLREASPVAMSAPPSAS
jgi:hemerythrin